MSDLELRTLERLGKGPKYWAAVHRADLWYDYLTPLGPLSILDAECADCCEPGLPYSNCSYCEGCHQFSCRIGALQDRQPIGVMVNHEKQFIAARREVKCYPATHGLSRFNG